MKRFIVAATVVVGGIVFAALPAFSDNSGVLNAKVSVASTCVTVAPGSIDFGTLPFTSSTSGGGGISSGSQSITVTNCSEGAENFLGKGYDAHGAGPSSLASWSLYQYSDSHIVPTPCSLGVNKYEAGIGGVFPDFTYLGTTDSALNGSWASAAAGEAKNGTAKLNMPCQGSVGVGEIMGFQLVVTAVPPS